MSLPLNLPEAIEIRYPIYAIADNIHFQRVKNRISQEYHLLILPYGVFNPLESLLCYACAGRRLEDIVGNTEDSLGLIRSVFSDGEVFGVQ
jgi:hypothetical protein